MWFRVRLGLQELRLGLTACLMTSAMASETVPLLDMASNGTLATESSGTTSVTQSFDVALQGASLCLWLSPRRLHSVNNIALVKDLKEGAHVQIILRQGSLEVLQPGCVFRAHEAPKLREWRHVCLVLSSDFGFYYDGKIVGGINECELNYGGGIVDVVGGYGDGDSASAVDDGGENGEAANVVEIVLGGSDRNALPFSGFLADVRLYSRSLTAEEVASVAALNGSSTDHFSVGVIVTGSRLTISGVEVSETEAEALLEAPKLADYLYFAEKTTYSKAREVCTKLGGEFLNYSKTDREKFTQNVTDYIDQVSVNINHFWVQTLDQNANEDICPSVRVAKTSPRLSLDYIPCDMAVSIVCQMPQDYELKILGLDEDNFFSPAYDTPGMLVSRSKYVLKYDDGQVTIQNVLNKEVIYERDLGSIEHLIGRPLLQEDDGGDHGRTLVLSPCQEDQFTCSCGSCVSLGDVCNFSLECPDGSDEIYCSHKHELPRDYKKEFSPSLGTRPKTRVGLKVVLENVEPMITNQNLLQLSLNITVVWRDRRLTFSFLEVDQPVRLTEEVFSDFWLPRIALDTAVEEDKDVLNFRESPGVLTATARSAGRVSVVGNHEARVFDIADLTMTKKVIVSFHCTPDLFLFPFDAEVRRGQRSGGGRASGRARERAGLPRPKGAEKTKARPVSSPLSLPGLQLCRIPLRLEGSLIPDSRWDAERTSVGFPKGLVVPLFSLSRLDVSFGGSPEEEEEEEGEEGKDTQVLLELSLERKWGAYLLNTFLPCVVLAAIGLITHIFPHEDFSDRVTTTLSCLIVMAAFFIQVSTALPTSAEPKLIDFWMLGHVLLMLMIFVTHVLVKSFLTEEEAQEKKEDCIPTILRPLQHKQIISSDTALTPLDSHLQKRASPTSCLCSAVGPPCRRPMDWPRIMNRMGFYAD
ncbi:uncharacterized protein LOC122246016 [Penaeus japonicus]|uniref:uncharacterized protein LOC122246016 n=1 Tax=Penaeus japonicus TaxID=27405 RepID=UPI001C70BC02|nr:uncharacterized protein LOC122246016 [Penaeus japonicus]